VENDILNPVFFNLRKIMREFLQELSLNTVDFLFQDSQELVLVFDNKLDILYSNPSADNVFGQIINIKDIEHNFSFDAYVLDKDKFFDFNPLREALISDCSFKAEITFQQASNIYRNFVLKSYDLKGKKLFVFSDCTEKKENTDLKEQSKIQELLLKNLRKENAELETLRAKAETMAIRTALVNRISNKIKDNLYLEEIIQTILIEICITLGLFHAAYFEFDADRKLFNLKYRHPDNIDFFDKFDVNKLLFQDKKEKNNKNFDINFVADEITDETRAVLCVNVSYQNVLLGRLFFVHNSARKNWQEEEINLIEGISSQLASALNQASLFKELEKQKHDVEKALLELRHTQAQLIQSEKMASLGHLVAGVAHEVNTPLGSIKSNNDIFHKCIDKMKTSSEGITKYSEILEETLKINDEAIKRVNNIVKSLKNFARLDEAEFKESDILEGIKSTLTLIKHELKGKIIVIEEFSDLPLINCYPNELNQVFMNLLVNACQSIGEIGTITIRTFNEKEKIKVEISDTGSGIPEKNLKKVFDPGFTTKGVGVGTGLGLSICYRIVERHKGKIFVDSKEGKGSVFTVELPKL